MATDATMEGTTEAVGGGGDRLDDAYVFDLSGGAPCLDFANTVSDRGNEPIERLTGYPRLLAWARQSDLLDDEAADLLAGLATAEPERAREVLVRALRLREALFELFTAAAAGRPADDSALAVFNRELPAAAARLRLVGDGDRYRLRDDPATAPDLAAPLAPVVRSAAELLSSETLDLVRECAADTCRWLFLDHSRNHSRRWCDMKVCGNRAKVRRHYRRQREVGSASG